MKTHSKKTWLGAGLIGLIALVPLASADKAKPAMVDAKATGKVTAELSVDAIVSKHLAALGGADLLRSTKTLTLTATGEKQGKKYTKTVYFSRPGLMRVDFEHDGAKGSKGFDGKVGWVKKAGEAVVAMNAEESAAMKGYADFDEPLLDYAKRGIAVKLNGLTEVGGAPAYELEITKAGGQTERQFIDASSFLLLATKSSSVKDGKTVWTKVKYGDYRKVQGRMVNHSTQFWSDGVEGKSVISQIAYDKQLDASLFAMPKR